MMERNVVMAQGAISVMNPDGVTRWQNNLFFSRSGEYHEVPDNVTKADPLITEATRGRYRFLRGSPAPNLGIEPLDLDQAGARGTSPKNSNQQ